MPIKIKSTGGGSVSLDVPSTGVDYTLTMPAEIGTIITTSTGSGINASAISVGTLPKARMPTGSILQVVHTTLGSSFTGTSVQTGTGYYIDITGLSATITPTSTTSKILILTNMYIGVTMTNSGYQQHFRIKRNGTRIILGTSEGGRPTSTGRINMYAINTYSMQNFSGVHYDSPASTSALTYQIELGGYSGSPIVYVNRAETFQAGANDYDSIPVTTLTLMEVAA